MKAIVPALPWLAIFAIGIGAVASVPQQGDAARSDDLAVRVQRIEDRAAIKRLLLDYGRDLDRGDFAAYSRLFAAEGEWSGSIGTFRGPAAIQAAMEKTFAPKPGVAAPKPRSFHLLTNAMIDIDGDRATAVSKWTFVRVADNKPVIANAGEYEDVLVRENGRWRFAKRVAPSVLTPAPG